MIDIEVLNRIEKLEQEIKQLNEKIEFLEKKIELHENYGSHEMKYKD